MDRINTVGVAADLFGAGKDGFKDGDLVNGIVPTDLNAAWFNGVQEELLNVIEQAGITPDAAVRTQLASAIQSGKLSIAAAGGTADAITATFTPAVGALANGLTLRVRAASANATATPTFAPNGLTAKTIVKGAGTALVAGDIAGAGHWLTLQYDATLDKWVLGNPATGVTTSKQLQPLSASVASNAMTLALGPTVLDFRSPTLTDGTPHQRIISSAISMTLSAGSTLGTAYVATYNTTYRIYVLAIDATALGGGVELAVLSTAGASAANMPNLDESGLITTVAEGGAGGADTAGVIYSAVARANVPFRVVGYVEGLLNTSTNGNWTSITKVQCGGGEALSAVSGLGYAGLGSFSPANNTTYYNTSERLLILLGTFSCSTTSTSTWAVHVNGESRISGSMNGTTANAGSMPFCLVVPPRGSYQFVLGGAALVGVVHHLTVRA